MVIALEAMTMATETLLEAARRSARSLALCTGEAVAVLESLFKCRGLLTCEGRAFVSAHLDTLRRHAAEAVREDDTTPKEGGS